MIDSDGVISVQTALDREQDPSYSLQIRATEISDSTSSSFVTVAITVTDINDNAPMFQQSSYSVDVSEGAGLQLVVYTGVSATDADTGNNALFEYSLSTTSSFSVEPLTGN